MLLENVFFCSHVLVISIYHSRKRGSCLRGRLSLSAGQLSRTRLPATPTPRRLYLSQWQAEDHIEQTVWLRLLLDLFSGNCTTSMHSRAVIACASDTCAGDVDRCWDTRDARCHSRRSVSTSTRCTCGRQPRTEFFDYFFCYLF